MTTRFWLIFSLVCLMSPVSANAVDLPPDIAAQLKSGSAHMANAEYDQAIVDFTAVIDYENAHPSTKAPLAFYQRGSAYGHVGKVDQAMSDFGTLIALNPNDPGGYSARSGGYAAQGNLKLAMADIDKAISLAPDDGFAYSTRARLLDEQKLYSKAIDDYSKAIGLLPAEDNLIIDDDRASRALDYEKLGNVDQAMAELNDIIKQSGNFDALFTRGSLYVRQGKYQLAVADFDQALGAVSTNKPWWPRRARYWAARGWAEYLAGDIATAIANEQKSIETDDIYAETHFDLALFYTISGKDDDALAECKKGIAAKSPDQQDLSIKHFEIALKLHPGNKTLSRELALMKAPAKG